MRKSMFIATLLLLIFTGTDCKKESNTVVPPDNPPDTTSHNFAWTQYSFGGQGGSSYFKDVAVVNDTLAFAVGAVYVQDSSGSSVYNAAKWDGREWKLLKIPFVGSCSAVMYPPLQAVWAFSSTNILFTNGGSIVRFDGTNAVMDCGMNALLAGAITKIFAITPQNIYIVGNAGTILHYNGTSWVVQQSGTTIDLRDVWGSVDGNVVWACGYSNDNFHSILLKYENNQWRTIWSRDGSTAVLPFGYNVGSVWKSRSSYVTSSNGIFRLENDTTQMKLSNSFSGFTPRLRGTADNDIVVIGDDAVIWHYNGQSGKQLNGGMPDQPLNSCDIKKNTIVAVGSDYGSFPNKALIYLGRR